MRNMTGGKNTVKPMSEKQRKAIEACEQLLGIKYEGTDSAQGAFFYLRDHIENARKEANRLLNVELELSTATHHVDSSKQDDVMNQMEFYRYDDVQHDVGDEDETYAETPTRESLGKDIRYWLSFL